MLVDVACCSFGLVLSPTPLESIIYKYNVTVSVLITIVHSIKFYLFIYF